MPTRRVLREVSSHWSSAVQGSHPRVLVAGQFWPAETVRRHIQRQKTFSHSRVTRDECQRPQWYMPRPQPFNLLLPDLVKRHHLCPLACTASVLGFSCFGLLPGSTVSFLFTFVVVLLTVSIIHLFFSILNSRFP